MSSRMNRLQTFKNTALWNTGIQEIWTLEVFLGEFACRWKEEEDRRPQPAVGRILLQHTCGLHTQSLGYPHASKTKGKGGVCPAVTMDETILEKTRRWKTNFTAMWRWDLRCRKRKAAASPYPHSWQPPNESSFAATFVAWGSFSCMHMVAD